MAKIILRVDLSIKIGRKMNGITTLVQTHSSTHPSITKHYFALKWKETFHFPLQISQKNVRCLILPFLHLSRLQLTIPCTWPQLLVTCIPLFIRKKSPWIKFPSSLIHHLCNFILIRNSNSSSMHWPERKKLSYAWPPIIGPKELD